jgi:hypothetical protein
MTGTRKLSLCVASAILLCLALQPVSASACAACYGANDSSMAKGMNAGIFSLLGVVVLVLGSVAGFFFYLIKKSTAAAQPAREGVSANAAWNQPSVLSTSDTDKTTGLSPVST